MRLRQSCSAWNMDVFPPQRVIQDFTLAGGNFFGIVNVCVRNRCCANETLSGGSGGIPPLRNFCKK